MDANAAGATLSTQAAMAKLSIAGAGIMGLGGGLPGFFGAACIGSRRGGRLVEPLHRVEGAMCPVALCRWGNSGGKCTPERARAHVASLRPRVGAGGSSRGQCPRARHTGLPRSGLLLGHILARLLALQRGELR
ncbi:MAG: hypothetical protein EBZ31_04990 [Flavobacteriia bacterium]|nr:hypothetical protein [Flavobacteriia bacterium]